MKRFTSLHSIVLIILILLQQQSSLSAFTSIVGGVSNKIGSIGYSPPSSGRSRNLHQRINNINHRRASSSTTSLSAVAITNLPLTAATSISTYYKASPFIAGFSIGLLCRMIQYTQDANNNTNTTNIKKRFSLRRGSNYAMVLCLGLVLGLLIEVLMYASGAAVPTICE